MTDNDLRNVLHRHLPHAPQSQWFVKKVVNRLPQRRVSGLELVAYVVAIVAALAFIAFTAVGVTRVGTLTVGVLIQTAVALGIIGAVGWNIVSSKLSV